MSDWLGHAAAVAVLAACLISAGNAVVRYAFDASSNAWLEIQWYLFGTAVMLGAGHVLARNEHVRVDLLYGMLGPRGKAWVDLFGLICFLLPVALLVAWLSWPFFIEAWRTGEMSSNAGGLVRWPAKLLLPLGFGMLALQALAEIVKRVCFLTGRYGLDMQYERPLQ